MTHLHIGSQSSRLLSSEFLHFFSEQFYHRRHFMDSQECRVCYGKLSWDNGANSLVCIDCGSLDDSTQTTLTNSNEAIPNGMVRDIILNPIGSFPLRTSSGRAIYGQTSNDREIVSRKREMHDFIISILRMLSQPGLADRACHLFDRSIELADFRWGRQVRLAASACIALSLNEARKGVTLTSIAVSFCLVLNHQIPMLHRR
jgi:transcription factor IIIB 90 kDa subunit